MKIGTKALVTLLIITALSLQTIPVATASKNISSRMQRQVQRVQQHHDRKLTLRAAVLGMDVEQLKHELKQKSFEKIMKEHGFTTKSGYLVALQGKIKDELKKRGLSEEKISKLLKKKEQRLETAS